MVDDGTPSGPDRPADRSPSDEQLEQRVLRDEIRLARDEERIAEEERWIRRSWRLELALGGLLALTIVGLVVGLMALNRDIDAVAAAAPRDDSIGSPALQDHAVIASKLADGAVTARAVGGNALTGVQIDEAKLARVPDAARADHAGRADRAASAARADTADDASALAGIAAGRYVRQLSLVRAETPTSTLAIKGPVSARCPAGTTIVGGGASIDGAARVAITTSAPEDDGVWVAEAAAIGSPSGPWKIVVSAVCARGG